MYNHSHKLQNNETKHKSTRLKINFPENANYVLIIHGRLVHSGAMSKMETNMSFNVSHDVRLFAYLSNLKNRVEADQLYQDHLEEGIVDRRTFNMCEVNANQCERCKNVERVFRRKKISCEEINIQDYIDLHNCQKKRSRTNMVQSATHKLVGDLDVFGWEVWTGLDTSLSDYQDLQRHLKILVLGNGKKFWNGIGSTPRKALKIDYLLGQPNTRIVHSLRYMANLFDDIKNNILKKIPMLGDNINTDARAILSNFSEVTEQEPHRDFSSVKR